MLGELSLADLEPGVLAGMFGQGHTCVLLRCAELVRAIWCDLLHNPAEQMPWEAPLIDLARNYHGSADITESLGDLFYFQPGQHGYIARKLSLSSPEGDGVGEGDAPIDVRPPYFVRGSQRYSLDQSTARRCMELGERLMASVMPAGAERVPFDIAVQRLKYQETNADFDLLHAMTRNSLGRWGRVGWALDEERSRAAGMLAPKGWSDLYGIMAHVPAVGPLARQLNRRLRARDRKRDLPPGWRVIEGPHYDYRYFSALCGRRDCTVTQIFDDGKWVDLPVDLDTLVIIPGTLSQQAYGIPHVMHRVLHVDGVQRSEPADPRTDDVTLLIGAA